MVWMVPVRASSEASVRMPRPVFQPPVWVVLAYSMTVVDVALILGPTAPPPLVRTWS